jgi:predicted amidohydrolase
MRTCPIFIMRAACLQLFVKPCQPDDNLRRALALAHAALEQGAQILVFPELFLTGFCYEPANQSAAEDLPPYPRLDSFRALAEEHDCLFVGSVRTRRENLGFCLDRCGLELRAKIHPFGDEKEHFDGGIFISPANTKWGRIGTMICYDLRFPEVARTLALQGADILATVAQFPALRLDQWRILVAARAIENQTPHLACNWANGGGSMIADSRGRVLAEAGLEETVIVADIDLSDRDLFRKEINCFADRRTEVYGWCGLERFNP